MTLITCPECGKEISNKSKQCIHCGYPLEDNNYSTTLYSMVLSKLNDKANPFVIKLFLEEIYGIPKNKASQLLKHQGSILIDGIEECNIDYLRDTFLSYGCIVEFVPSEIQLPNEKNIEWKGKLPRSSKTICCPRCGSTQITTGQRGFSFITGFIGANKTTNRCANCGHSWQPK